MNSLWNDAEATQFSGPLGPRVYTSRLLGRDKSLVLHGGGNTSVKLREKNLFGEDEDVLDRHFADWTEEPLERLLDERMRTALIKAIEDLPEREQKVMALYYQEELNLREIGDILGVSESRVCQLHGQAVARLRARLREKV